MIILALSGSLQAASSNSALIRAAAKVLPPGVTLEVWPSLGDLPHFNPDLDGETAPAVIQAFRTRLVAAAGVLIASPEYGHGMPGTLKNALDWIVGSGELVGKPVALMNASPGAGGIRAQLALTQTLTAMSANVVEALVVALVRGKLDAHGEVADPYTLDRIAATVSGLVRAVSET
jgi:chromate reductase